jgi:uncharacterized protein (TIGR02117 family)
MPPKIHPLRNGARLVGVAFAGLIGVLLAYATAGMIGGTVPSNAGWIQPESGVRIYVESNGVHTGIVLPQVGGGVEGGDWRDLLRPEDLRDPRYARYSHVSIGWGDRTFYLETPTWADVKPLTILAAAAGSERTVMHVDHVPEPRLGADNEGDVRSMLLRPEEYRRLVAFIRASFRSENGQRPAHQVGYGPYDAFYDARGRYSAVQTCNAWTGDALRHAGVRVGTWTPFPVTVLGWFK